MLEVHEGQCGLCAHFGEDHLPEQKIAQVRQSHQAPDDLLEDCGHPTHAPLHLKVTPTSRCDGFKSSTIR